MRPVAGPWSPANSSSSCCCHCPAVVAPRSARLVWARRDLSAAAVMFHTALAACQGLTATEEKALDLLDRYGPLTGRQLAQRSALAPASVTNLLDRLEAKGFARRTRNPADGRSVLIEMTPDRLASLGQLFTDWTRELEELTGKYTDAELAVITDFLTESARRQKNATARLTSAAAGKGQADPAAQAGGRPAGTDAQGIKGEGDIPAPGA